MNSVQPTGKSTRNSVESGAIHRISVRDLTKDYVTQDGRVVRALENVNFHIRDQEFISVIGPSGCGKTTLLKILAGISEYFDGDVVIDGKPIVHGKSTGAGVVFQAPVLLPWRNVFENILLPAQIMQVGHVKAVHKKAHELLTLVGLQGTEELYPSELSGGMQQRVAICRALIMDPIMLLMDEPFGALDALTRETMNLEIQRIWLETGKTVVFITHSIPEAVFLADRVLALKNSPGSVEEIVEVNIERPRKIDVMISQKFGEYVSYLRKLMDSKATVDL